MPTADDATDDATLARAFGARVREQRERKGMTQGVVDASVDKAAQLMQPIIDPVTNPVRGRGEGVANVVEERWLLRSVVLCSVDRADGLPARAVQLSLRPIQRLTRLLADRFARVLEGLFGW